MKPNVFSRVFFSRTSNHSPSHSSKYSLKHPLALLPVLIFFFSLLFSCSASYRTQAFNAMNTFVTMKVYGSRAETACQKVEQRILELEKMLSVTDLQSDIFKVNNAGGEPVAVHDETFFLAQYAEDFYKSTGGVLNPALYPVIREWGFTTGNYKIPDEQTIASLLPATDFAALILDETEKTLRAPKNMMLDFGASGKGFAGDEAVKILKGLGVTSALLDLGGNIQVLGAKPDGSAWNIAIKNPWDGSAAAAVKIKNGCLITSGGYERNFTGPDGKRYIHIFDAKTGRPVENKMESVSIVADSGLYADSLSTALFAMGLDAATDFWKSRRDFETVLITRDKKIYYPRGLKDKIQVLADFEIFVIE